MPLQFPSSVPFHPLLYCTLLVVAMDHSSDDDDDCFSVQLDSTDMFPKATKTILWQRFTMRRYNLEHDGRLTNLAKAMDLIAGNFVDDDLRQILNAQLDTLAISPQAKQGILPALFGITKLTDAQLRGMLMSWSQTELDSASLLRCSTGISVDMQLAGSSPPYQARQRSFTSNSGSGYTTWYFAKSDTNITSPPMVPQTKTGHLYVHLNTSTNSHQYWMVGINNQWDIISKGSEYPLNHDRVLSIHSNGNPSWIT
ncbi:hypothetical protein F5148DRAFT_1149809 [Russula earlei]|uniref:Uncharacterized protein n=1 Tax=Russula earlei TaxID=71964 RepID=A0ACC0U7X5_9AGAM|nr:hypothetical protein F5148DRAFT_1149809 [Russula earlei]